MGFPWEESRRAFDDAAQWFLDTVGAVGDRWGEPGLGEWDVRDLVGHTSRALLTVEAYLDRPAASVDVDSAAGYVRAARTAATSAQVAARGHDAGAALGPDPVAGVRTVVDRVRPLVAGQDGTAVVTTIAGGMRLSDYLPTRTLELVVHTSDLATALGLRPDVPPAAGAQALAIVSDLALADGRVGPLLLLATGRPVPPGFSVL